MAKGFNRPAGGQGGGAMMAQLKRLQEQMETAQEQLSQETVTSSAGGGAVKVTITGKREITAIEIRPDAVDPDDVEMLQDLLVAAVNEAIRKVDDISESEMSKITSGINIPGIS